MNDDFSSFVIPNRRTGASVHKQLIVAKKPMLVLGRFYCSMIDRGIWDTQKTMAADLGISPFKVSRMIAAARLPEEVQALFETRALVFKTVHVLNVLVGQIGANEMVRRATSISPNTSIENILAVLTTGKPVPQRGIRVSIAPDAKSLRIDVPDIALVAPRLEEIEQLLNVVLGISAEAKPAFFGRRVVPK